jgi:hypothetical protein
VWCCLLASCGSIGVEWFGNATDSVCHSYGIGNHHQLDIRVRVKCVRFRVRFRVSVSVRFRANFRVRVNVYITSYCEFNPTRNTIYSLGP